MNEEPTFGYPVTPQGLRADWMKECAEAIYDKPLCQLPLPGSHDAGSFGAITMRSKTQQRTVTQQLEFGSRYFDFRVIADGNTFFSHHGSDHSRDNPYYNAITNDVLLWHVRNFCEEHIGEVVILSFGDFKKPFTALSASHEDKWRFAEVVKDTFRALLIPKSKKIPTYKQCIGAKQRVLIIFDDDFEDPMIWKKSDCVVDQYSALSPGNSPTQDKDVWALVSELTIEDQHERLRRNRDFERFYISQAILDYQNWKGTTTDNSDKLPFSRNYAGAERMNPLVVLAYKKWRVEELNPNILLMDFTGEFEDFAGTCKELLTKK